MSKDENRDDNREENAAGSARFSKEAKIGVTVIVVLLIGLGAAVVMRLGGSSSDEAAVAAAQGDAGHDKLGGDDKTIAMLKDVGPKNFGGVNPSKAASAKVVPARPARSEVGDLDRWKVASDRGAARRSAGDGPSLGAPPPSFAPDPPKPPRADRYDRYALDPPAQSDAAGAKPPDRAGSDARLMAPPDYETAGSDYRRQTRDDVIDVQPVRSPPAYGADDYRREPSSFRQSNHQSRRSAAASLYDNPPPRRDDGKYEVQPNDSFWTISERLYGTGAYFKALAEHNRGKGVDEERLQPGELILAPAVAQLEQSYPDLCPKPSRREALQSQSRSRESTVSTRNQYRGGRTYTVVEGDTLFNIARYELGKASRWAEIYELNRDVLGKDFNYLTPGIQLSLPEGEKSDVIAQPPGNVYRR